MVWRSTSDNNKLEDDVKARAEDIAAAFVKNGFVQTTMFNTELAFCLPEEAGGHLKWSARVDHYGGYSKPYRIARKWPTASTTTCYKDLNKLIAGIENITADIQRAQIIAYDTRVAADQVQRDKAWLERQKAQHNADMGPTILEELYALTQVWGISHPATPQILELIQRHTFKPKALL